MTVRTRTRRISARDVTWLPVESAKVVGPLAGITVEAIRAALLDLHRQRPQSPAMGRLDPARRRWRELPAAAFARWSHRLVLPGDPGEDVAGALDRLAAEPLGDRPIVLLAGGPWAGMKMSHAAGDGRAGNALLAAVLAAAATGRPAHHPSPRPARLPLLRATAHQLRRRPGRLAAALRVARPPRPEPVTDAVPWQPGAAYLSARSGPGVLPELRRWRDAHTPGVSLSAVLFATVHTAITRCLGEPDPPGLVVLVDARRYLPAGTAVEGNFAWGEHLTPAAPGDPRAVHAALGALLRSRRALTMLALHNVRAFGSGGAPELPAVGAKPRPHLTVTHLGRADAFDRLPWSGPAADRRLASVVTPGGPQSVTVSLEEMGGALHAAATYHDTVFDPEAVAAALHAVTKDPAGLLDSCR
jgi:hypothetical protein